MCHKRLPPNSGEGIVAFQTNISGRLPDVRFGSLADIGGSNCDVRFTPESGHCLRVYEYTPSADNRNERLPVRLHPPSPGTNSRHLRREPQRHSERDR